MLTFHSIALSRERAAPLIARAACAKSWGSCVYPSALSIVAIFYPFGQFCELNISLLSLQTQLNTAPNLFQRGVEYGEYECPLRD